VLHTHAEQWKDQNQQQQLEEKWGEGRVREKTWGQLHRTGAQLPLTKAVNLILFNASSFKNIFLSTFSFKSNVVDAVNHMNVIFKRFNYIILIFLKLKTRAGFVRRYT
jgi:hypothetical protein